MLSGHSGTFPLTAAAKDVLLTYLATARSSATPDAEGDEILRDLEISLGDRLRAVLDSGVEVLDEKVVRMVVAESGPVAVERGPSGPVPWLVRIQEGKWAGGICLGLAARAELNADWLRTVAFFALLLTGGLLGVAYLVVMLFVPRYETVEDYRAALRAAGHRATR